MICQPMRNILLPMNNVVDLYNHLNGKLHQSQIKKFIFVQPKSIEVKEKVTVRMNAAIEEWNNGKTVDYLAKKYHTTTNQINQWIKEKPLNIWNYRQSQ